MRDLWIEFDFEAIPVCSSMEARIAPSPEWRPISTIAEWPGIRFPSLRSFRRSDDENVLLLASEDRYVFRRLLLVRCLVVPLREHPILEGLVLELVGAIAYGQQYLTFAQSP